MTVAEAKHRFATLMQRARGTQGLTDTERAQLRRASQIIRYAKRTTATRQNRKITITRKKARQILHEGVAQGRPLTAKQRGFFGARASGYPLRKNPEMVRMGRLVEIRYYRDHGRNPGYYKHPFKRRPTIWYRPSDDTIIIR